MSERQDEHTRSPQAFEAVLAWVDGQIVEGHLKVGDRLPPERELAASLDVSRAAAREAIRTMQAQGVVRSSVGAGAAGGTVITNVPTQALTRLLRLHVALANFPLTDVVEVRVALERLSARLAARNGMGDQLEPARRALEAMEEPDVDRRTFNDADTAFHVALATAAGNRLATDLTVAIRESMRLPILDRFRQLDDWDVVVARLRKDHAAIFSAICRRDADAAEDLVDSHIRSAWALLEPGSAAAGPPTPPCEAHPSEGNDA